MAQKDKNIFSKARWGKGKMSQAELADIMNVTVQTIRNWESKSNQPNVHNIIRLAKELDLTYDEIINYYGKEEK